MPPLLNDRLFEQFEQRGTDVEYVKVPDTDHISVLTEAAPQVHTWVREASDG